MFGDCIDLAEVIFGDCRATGTPTSDPKRFALWIRALARLQDWEKLTEGEQHFVKHLDMEGLGKVAGNPFTPWEISWETRRGMETP